MKISTQCLYLWNHLKTRFFSIVFSYRARFLSRLTTNVVHELNDSTQYLNFQQQNSSNLHSDKIHIWLGFHLTSFSVGVSSVCKISQVEINNHSGLLATVYLKWFKNQKCLHKLSKYYKDINLTCFRQQLKEYRSSSKHIYSYLKEINSCHGHGNIENYIWRKYLTMDYFYCKPEK